MIGLIMLLAAGQSATFMGGNDLYTQCTGDTVAQLRCLNYVVGVADGIAVTEMTNQPVPPQICIPNEASQRQLMDVAVKFMRDNPEH